MTVDTTSQNFAVSLKFFQNLARKTLEKSSLESAALFCVKNAFEEEEEKEEEEEENVEQVSESGEEEQEEKQEIQQQDDDDDEEEEEEENKVEGEEEETVLPMLSPTEEANSEAENETMNSQDEDSSVVLLEDALKASMQLCEELSAERRRLLEKKDETKANLEISNSDLSVEEYSHEFLLARLRKYEGLPVSRP